MLKPTLSRRTLENHSLEIINLIDNELTKTQKCYIMLYYKDQLTIREIAQRCDVSPSTVSRTIRRGMTKLSHILETVQSFGS
ncbi:MAG: helix-turn-helix domain-containing protein [Ruminococcus sp.]|nr:helix-turn-helix domain-containing protein [Ruminococcus sp.]